jgi:very-short-patch-repair endonuclease
MANRALSKGFCLFRGSLKMFHKKRKRKKSRKASDKARRAQTKRIQKQSKRLKKVLPRSEQWFMKTYHSMQDQYDKFNEVLGWYIPDVHNPTYKYIIEIDGSYHDRPDQKAKDLRKDLAYRRQGYTVIRIKAYDFASLEAGLKIVLELRNEAPVLDDNTAAGCPLESKVTSTP